MMYTLYGDEVPPVIVMGHSMGGAVAVNVASSEKCPASLVGVVVIDVVEGTALGALASMQSFLRSRPQSFNSIEDAVRWRLVYGSVGFGLLTNILICCVQFWLRKKLPSQITVC